MQVPKYGDPNFSTMVGNMLGEPNIVTELPSLLVKTIECSNAPDGKHKVDCVQWGREINMMTVQDPTSGESSKFALHVESSTNYAAELRKDDEGKTYVKVVEQYRPTCTRQLGPVVSRLDMPGGYDLVKLAADTTASDEKVTGVEGAKTEFEEETGSKAKEFDIISYGFEEAVYKQRRGSNENTVGFFFNKDILTDNKPVRTENKGEITISYYMPVEEIIRSVQEDKTLFGTPGVVLWSIIFAASEVKLTFNF